MGGLDGLTRFVCLESLCLDYTDVSKQDLVHLVDLKQLMHLCIMGTTLEIEDLPGSMDLHRVDCVVGPGFDATYPIPAEEVAGTDQR